MNTITEHRVCAACTSQAERDALTMANALVDGLVSYQQRGVDRDRLIARAERQVEALVAKLQRQHERRRCGDLYAVSV